jgi:hypothetical protein
LIRPAIFAASIKPAAQIHDDDPHRRGRSNSTQQGAIVCRTADSIKKGWEKSHPFFINDFQEKQDLSGGA